MLYFGLASSWYIAQMCKAEIVSVVIDEYLRGIALKPGCG